jgi:hypothetical protein
MSPWGIAAIHRLARLVPKGLRRRLEVFLIDRGFPTKKKSGAEGIRQLGHRGYVGRKPQYELDGRRQLEFMIRHGLRPSDVLCDIACGSLRGGRLFIEYLERGNYLGLEGEAELVELGLRHELDPAVREEKVPEFVISFQFEFGRFSRSPTHALAVSLFSHLNEADIRLCLGELAANTTGPCQLFASYFESERPKPNFRKSHPQLAFYYTREQMGGMGHDAGWKTHFIGPWGSPAGQLMMRFYKE